MKSPMVKSPIPFTGDNRPAGAIVAQRYARSNGGDVTAATAETVSQAGSSGMGPADRWPVRPAACSKGGISPVR